MIVVDTNVLAYLYLPCEYIALAEKLLEQDSEWVAPIVWRSELRNVLALYLRKQLLSFEQAYGIQQEAELLLADHEYEVDSFAVLQLVNTSECSAFDCEFAVLAQRLGIQLVTQDKKLIKNFPGVALSLSDAVS